MIPTHWVRSTCLFLAHGADATLKNKEGLTAADRASQRGLEDAARLLRAKEG